MKGEGIMAKYTQLIESIIAAVGGKENIKASFHCATRLRLVLKDLGIYSADKLKAAEGVLGTQIVGEQLQIIIGPHVAEVYDEFCQAAGIPKEAAIDENLDSAGSLTGKKLGSRIIDVISGSFVPLIPIIIAASFIKLLATILGPTMLNLISAESDLYTLFTFVGDAGFYFLPVFMGYSAAKKMGVSVVLGLFMGAVMIHPTLTALVSSGEPFTVYGIPMTLVNYSSSTIPMILIIWVMSYVERFFKKVIPNSIKMIFVPLCTMLVMLPVALCIVGPLGSLLGSAITNGLLGIASLGTFGVIIVCALGGGLWNVLVLCGMHLAYYMAGVTLFIENGSDPMIMTTVVAGTMGLFGMTVGALIRNFRDSEARATFTGYLLTHLIGGVTEPALFGIGMKYSKPFVGAILGGAAGGVYYAVSGAAVTTMTAASNFLIFTQFAGAGTSNFINGVIGGLIAAAVAALYTYFFGFSGKRNN